MPTAAVGEKEGMRMGNRGYTVYTGYTGYTGWSGNHNVIKCTYDVFICVLDVY